MTEKPGAVFDCNLFLQAVGKGGNHAYRCLRLVEEGSLVLYMSEACLSEIDDVLRRPEVRAVFPMLDDARGDALMDWVRRHATMIDPVPHVFDYPVDPKDEPYIDLAIAAEAVYLVSWDKHIRRLASADNSDGERFRREHPSVSVKDPRTFLEEYYGCPSRERP